MAAHENEVVWTLASELVARQGPAAARHATKDSTRDYRIGFGKRDVPMATGTAPSRRYGSGRLDALVPRRILSQDPDALLRFDVPRAGWVRRRSAAGPTELLNRSLRR